MITRRRIKTAEAPQPEAAPSRMRRFRAKPAEAAPKEPARDYYGESIKALQSVAKLEDQIEKLTQQKAAHERHVDFLMAEGNLTHVDDGAWQADRKQSPGRASTSVDLDKFKKYVGNEKFQTVISVSVTDAKSLVAETEYVKAGITSTQGKAGDFKTTIARVKKK